MNASEAARHTGMNESDLRSMNNIPPRMLIKAGSTLLVPRTAQMDNDVSSHVADNAQVSLSPEITTRRTTVKARKGESVASIASRYGVAAASVANWNNVNAQAAFKRGQQVVLHLPITARAVVSDVVTKPAPSKGKTAVQAVRRDTGKAVVKSRRK
jgi:membrane-bound lytic murein transglycosylase D